MWLQGVPRPLPAHLPAGLRCLLHCTLAGDPRALLLHWEDLISEPIVPGTPAEGEAAPWTERGYTRQLL